MMVIKMIIMMMIMMIMVDVKNISHFRLASKPSNFCNMSRIDHNLRPHFTCTFLSFSELCAEKAMVAYTKPQQWKKEESEKLRGERSDQVY